jgi:hypothetical protein
MTVVEAAYLFRVVGRLYAPEEFESESYAATHLAAPASSACA